MLDVMSLKNELTSVVNNLAKSVVTEIITAAEKCTLNKQAQGNEEELDALVDELCVEAIDKILRIVDLVTTTKQQDLPSIKLNKSSQTEEDAIQAPQGKENCGPRQPEAQTFILICGNPVSDKKNPLVLAENCDTGKNKPCDSVDDDEDSGSCPDHEEDSTPPPTPPECTDHGYARPSSPPASSTDEGGDDAARRKKRKVKKMAGGGKRKKDASIKESMEFQHQCPKCTMIFPSEERLSEHLGKAHPVCQTCGELFTSVPNLREHELKVHGVLPYNCEHCDKSFSHRAHLNVHVKSRHTGEKTCHCDVCGKGYSCVSLLKTHRLTHFDKTFTCDVCGKSFYHACHLTRHKQVHREVRPFLCTTCGKGFTQAENLRAHQAIHTDEKQLCSICGKSYRGLKNHMISKHSHELPPEELPAKHSLFTCDACGKKFLNGSQFKLHKKTHTGEKPFHCDICGKSYRLKETLRDHKYTHTGEKPYKCTTCEKTFNTSTSFMRHKSIHTGEMPYSCKDCGKHFRLLTFLKAHEQSLGHRRRTTDVVSVVVGENTTDVDVVSVIVGENTNSSRSPAHDPKWHKKPRSKKSRE